MLGTHVSVRAVAEDVSELIDRHEFDRALKLIHDFVERIITEPLCTSQVFGSKTLDELCLRIGHASFAQVKRETLTVTQLGSQGPVFVYVVTKLQRSGGHTRVLEDFIKAQQGGLHIILSTELDGKSDVDYLNNGLAKQASVLLEQSPNRNFQERLEWLQKRLIELAPRKVYLFNHHQDSVAAAAMQPQMNLDASFYHHGDHHLCLGVYLSHLKHIDLHPMGYHHCREELGIKNIYIPLTVDDKGARSSDLPFLHDGKLTTCTAARANKIEVPYFTSYVDLVPKLLKATGGKHIHIGRLSIWALFKIRQGLKSHGIAPDKFVYTPWVPSVWKALQEHGVDLYVASFPHGGGLTLIEAMGAGIPVALHRHMFSRVLSGIDLAYSEAFNWRQPEELLHYCSELTVSDLRRAGQLGRMQYEKFHSNEHLYRALNDASYQSVNPSPLSSKFTIEADEWGLWMERQLNARRLVFRAIYRALRRFRARWY